MEDLLSLDACRPSNMDKALPLELQGITTHALDRMVEGDVESPMMAWLDKRVVPSPSRPLSGHAYFLFSDTVRVVDIAS